MHEQGSDDLLICGLMEFPLIRLAETQVKDRRGKKEATCVYSTHLGHTYLISSSEHTPKQKKHVHSETTDLRDSERHFLVVAATFSRGAAHIRKEHRHSRG